MSQDLFRLPAILQRSMTRISGMIYQSMQQIFKYNKDHLVTKSYYDYGSLTKEKIRDCCLWQFTTVIHDVSVNWQL